MIKIEKKKPDIFLNIMLFVLLTEFIGFVVMFIISIKREDVIGLIGSSFGSMGSLIVIMSLVLIKIIYDTGEDIEKKIEQQ